MILHLLMRKIRQTTNSPPSVRKKFLSMIERQISQSETYDGQGHAKFARACAVAILAISVVYALMLPSGGLSSMSYDAFRFLAGADSILASGTYLDVSGAPQAHWPPGTSILYAAGASLSGRPPEELVKFVNLAALLLMAGSLWLIIEITIERWWIALITFASIFLNTAILSLQNKLWSDPLALATCSAAIASGIVACRGGKNWYGWILVGSVFLSIAICIRYAMLPGIPILAAVAFWCSKRTASHREAVLFPILSPSVTLISFYFFRSSPFSSSGAYTIRSVDLVTMVTSFDIRDSWSELVQMTNQVFPAVLPWFSVAIVTVGLIAVPAGAVFMTWMPPQKRSALLICVGYVLLSCIFLIIVIAVLGHTVATSLFRYLLQIYPFIIVGAALAADLLLNRQRLDSRILGFIIVGLLSTGAARSARAAALGILRHGSQQSASCVSSGALRDDLKRIPATQIHSGVLTNIQGLAWYAMRIPTIGLTWSALADAPSGTIIIFARPEYLCPDVLESEDISEIELTRRAPDVSIVSSSGVLLIGRKQ
jgi:hypothetical protein